MALDVGRRIIIGADVGASDITSDVLDCHGNKALAPCNCSLDDADGLCLRFSTLAKTSVVNHEDAVQEIDGHAWRSSPVGLNVEPVSHGTVTDL